MAATFYIPRIRETWTEEQIYCVLYDKFGIVERVDFGETIQPGIRYGFVHMSIMNPNFAEEVDEKIQKNGHFKMQVTPNEFWMFLPNKNPIPATSLNIHQLAEITKKQEERISFLESIVFDLKSQVEILKSKNPCKPGTISLASDSLDNVRENINKKFYGIDFEKDVELFYSNWQEIGIDANDEYA